MTIYLSHNSALRYWLTCDLPSEALGQDGSHSLVFASTNMRDIKQAELPFEYGPKQKLHVLCDDHDAARNKKSVNVHSWTGPVGAGCFCEYSEDCQISTPEFTFIQMAANCSLIELIEIGTYLCAGFSIESGQGFKELRKPVTSISKLESFLWAMEGTYAVKKARDALKFVIPDAASPMEVFLCLAFSLPARLGGWGYPEVQANHTVDIPQHLRGMLGFKQLRCDIYFPSVNGDVEFDGAAYHSSEERLDYTQTRRNVLEAMGIKTISATKLQLNTYEKFNDFMWMAIEYLGLPLHIFSSKQAVKQRELYHQMSRYHSLF